MKRVTRVGGAAVALLACLGRGEASAQTLDCLIHPNVVVAISSPGEGVLESVGFDRGDLVRAGEVVATLESSVERATLRGARARAEMQSPIRSSRERLDFAVRRYLRTLDVFRKEIVSVKEMDEAETANVLAESDLLQAQENQRVAETDAERAAAVLSLRTIRSPVTGVVIERLLSPGELVRPGPILKVAQIDPLRVEAFAPLPMLGRIAVGMTTHVVPEAPVNGVHVARVTVVDRVVDAASGTFGVRLELPNPDNRLPAGLKCKVRFPR